MSDENSFGFTTILRGYDFPSGYYLPGDPVHICVHMESGKEIQLGVCEAFHADGITEVVRADEHIEIAAELFFNPLYRDVLARDGNLVMIKGMSTYAWYEIIGQSYMRDTYIAHLIRKETLNG